MEKRPVVIEGTFEDVVRRFHTEMQKGKKNFSYCGEMPGQDAQNKTLVRVYERYFLYPNIVATVTVFFEELEEKKTSITYMLSSYELGLLGIDFGVSGSMTREVEKRIEAVRLLEA